MYCDHFEFKNLNPYNPYCRLHDIEFNHNEQLYLERYCSDINTTLSDKIVERVINESTTK